MPVTIGPTISHVDQKSASENPGNETLSHTVDDGTTVIWVAWFSEDTRNVVTATWNGVNMTEDIAFIPESDMQLSIYYATNDLSGTHDIYLEVQGTTFGRFSMTVLNLINAKTSDPIGTTDTTYIEDTQTVESGSIGSSGDLLIDAVLQEGRTGSLSMLSGNGQTARDGRSAADSNGSHAASAVGVSSISGPSTMGWQYQASGRNFIHIAMVINEQPITNTYTADTAGGIVFSGNSTDISVNIPPTPEPEDTIVEFNPFSAAFRGTPRTHKLIVWTNVRS